MGKITRFLACIAFLGLLVSPSLAGTRIWNLYGWGDNAFNSSAGINQLAAAERNIPGVTYIRVYNYWQTQQVANEIMAAPAGDNFIVVGYSCGANSATAVAAGLVNVRKVYPVGIQESLWCGGYPLGANVPAAQETYAGCLLTLGFGCKQYAAGPGFAGHLVLIKRPDLHPLADTDPDAQKDVLSFIATVANPTLKGVYSFRLKQQRKVTVVTRYHGQRP